MKKTVALIYGGEGAEHTISVRSAEQICSYIDREKYAVLPVYISHEGSWYLPRDPFGKMPTAASRPTYPVRLHGRSGFLAGGDILAVDLALPILHGDFGEDGRIQGALDVAHIPYVSCPHDVGALCADKAYTKIVAEWLGIPTAEWIATTERDAGAARKLAEEKLSYPMFIKPCRLGSSIGAAAVECEHAFYAAYTRARAFDTKVLIERHVPIKCEVECAYLGTKDSDIYLAGGVIDTGGATYGYNEKYNGHGTAVATHGKRAGDEYRLIAEWAKKLGSTIGLRHYSRLDFFIARDGQIYFNEINTIPGMTRTSLFPALTEDMGLAHGEFINRIIAEALV